MFRVTNQLLKELPCGSNRFILRKDCKFKKLQYLNNDPPDWQRRNLTTVSGTTKNLDGTNNRQQTDRQGDLQKTSLRPIWFIFSGLGSQWNQLPKELYRIEPFAESLSRSRKILKNLDIDMETVLHPANEQIYSCLRTALVSVTTIQMALFETVKALLPASPSGLIGHSNGEALCGYADGAVTAEQIFFLLEARVKAMEELLGRNFGGMAAVGLSWSQIQSRVPGDIYPACNNSKNSVLVSGSRQSILSFIDELKKESIFASEVPVCGCPAHSPYIEGSCRHFEEYSKTFLPQDTAKLRSPAWICTSALEKDWDSRAVKYASWEYFGNNVRNQVYFYEALLHIPKNAFVVEISPKAIFGGIVKETVGGDSK